MIPSLERLESRDLCDASTSLAFQAFILPGMTQNFLNNVQQLVAVEQAVLNVKVALLPALPLSQQLTVAPLLIQEQAFINVQPFLMVEAYLNGVQGIVGGPLLTL